MSEFQVLLTRVDDVKAEVVAVKVALAEHCAADEAVKRPRAPMSNIVSSGIALLSLAVAALALFVR
jgi:hypothetical protein